VAPVAASEAVAEGLVSPPLAGLPLAVAPGAPEADPEALGEAGADGISLGPHSVK
jgi:hypothetical protein